ncbi:GNAT family N-acetyltransferase [Stutzerimonas xanthomarina]|uniref:GNAT family N-acetyltransferase n=2 Tax=Stutzerimonas xanthomarina TaxID=271420 RepID=UPI003AA9399C
MEATQLRQLPDESRPLLNKFYRAHRSHMRAPAGARYWVAGHSDILAGLCLTGVDGGNWLTGLLVAPSRRKQGLGRRLVAQALAGCEGPVWLFCEPRMVPFYTPLGFAEATALPEALASRLQRYNQHKMLVALCHENENAR